MKLHTAVGSALFLLLATGTAVAEDNASIPNEWQRPSRGKIDIDITQADITTRDEIAEGGPISSRLIFLNNCKPGGCVVRSGFESSINNTSSIISGTRTITPFAYSDAVWDDIVDCVRNIYAPFNVGVTDQDPGSVNHWESIVAGEPQDAGFGNGTGGVSPFSCGIINNSITYDFANIYGPNVEEICWTVAQETAHSFGLEHERLATDPMTYIGTVCGTAAAAHSFQNQAAPCGECSNTSCDCGGTTQNSYQMIMDIFGASTPSPPAVTITEPDNGQAVSPGFIVRGDIVDDNGIGSASLIVDGQTILTLTLPPFVFNAPETLLEGTHTVTLRATDFQGTVGEDSIDVVIGEPCETPGDCVEQGDNLTCVGGRCVPGEGADGGLGDECESGPDCFSGQCASDGEGNKYCVESCDLGESDCPGDFGCLDVGNGNGVCWPGAGDGGGCLDAGGEAPTMPIVFGLFVGVMALVRRRRVRA